MNLTTVVSSLTLKCEAFTSQIFEILKILFQKSGHSDLTFCTQVTPIFEIPIFRPISIKLSLYSKILVFQQNFMIVPD